MAGVPGIFIRMAGCPLRCKWCDTKYAWQTTSGTEYTVAEIMQKIQKFKSRFVIITGGEPMIDADIVQLTKSLKDCDKHITIETCGIAYVPNAVCDLMSIKDLVRNFELSSELILKKLIKKFKKMCICSFFIFIKN